MRTHLLLVGLLLIAAGCEDPVSRARQQTAQAQADAARAAEAAQARAKQVAAEQAATQEATQRTVATGKVAEPPKPLSDEELAGGWIALFDGHSLFGWKAHSKADWQVVDGTIRVTGGEKGLLCTSVQFDNYELVLEFRAAEGTNSGVFLRTAPVVGMDDVRTRCYELNIAPPDNPFPTGSFVARQKAEEVPERAGEWQSFHVTLDGGQSRVALNGEEVLTYDDAAPIGRGHIGLQLNEGQVEFRNIKLRPLGLTPIFNGQDLTGWKDHPRSESTFTVTDAGELNVTSKGRGCIESQQQFGDFALQLECISHAPNLNSGIFFRCVPGSFMDGYESQIHNGFKSGDRTQPVDCGTGGIFRRVDARVVVPSDQEWFHKTIVADGPQIAVWVNGYQVTDWTDERQPHDNPRNGQRLAAGTLQIQGHDPTTNLSFRNLRAREMAE